MFLSFPSFVQKILYRVFWHFFLWKNKLFVCLDILTTRKMPHKCSWLQSSSFWKVKFPFFETRLVFEC
jgi:hypothetical protein